MSQIVQQASMIHYVSNGKFKMPLVIRAAMGDIRSSGPHHSHSFYSYFMHIPGLKVVVPSLPYDVKGLLKTSIRDDNPVMFIEHKALYSSKGPVPQEEYTIPFGEAVVRREGKDVTLVAVGQLVFRALEAAEILAKQGISVEVIDPRTVAPLDKDTILDSILKTGRLAIADEAYSNCGFTAEVAAMAAEEALDELDAPVRRICALPAPHAFSPSLDSHLQPSTERMVREITELLKD
jgi:pyruvate dehydrogenase E1 component beta subunit